MEDQTHAIDLTGLKCPIPLVKMLQAIKTISVGESLLVKADDPAFCMDVQAWCKRTGHELVDIESSSDQCAATVRKSA